MPPSRLRYAPAAAKWCAFPTCSLLAHARVMVRVVAGAVLTATVPGFGKVVSHEV